MKHIKRVSAPAALSTHIEVNHDVDLSWEAFYGEPKRETKRALLIEQGYLCGYLGVTISENDAHFEHLKARCLCDVDAGEQVQYENLILAYPGPNYRGQCRYGAHPKASYNVALGFVSPLDADCENRFRFDARGHVTGLDTQARKTVEVLRLDDSDLIDLRRKAIEEMLFADIDESSDLTQEYELIMDAMDKRDTQGHFQEFCFAIKQICASLLAE